MKKQTKASSGGQSSSSKYNESLFIMTLRDQCLFAEAANGDSTADLKKFGKANVTAGNPNDKDGS